MKPLSYRKVCTSAVALAIMGTMGCKKFLDVNTSPNSPLTATENLILPSSQAAMGMVVGNNLQIFGSFYAQYWTQNPSASQYKAIDQYLSTSSTSDRMWGILYNDGLQDMEVLTQSKNNQYVAIALIQKAYTFQLLTDAFGDIPLKEALKGNANLAPHYDSQKEVYDSIFSWSKQGIALINPASGKLPGTDDIIFGGGAAGMRLWKAFGNTLLLKAYLRLSEVDATTAKAGIEALYATSPDFLTTDAKLTYYNVGGNYNPLYAEGVGLGRTQNPVASLTAVRALNTNSDPRLKTFYTVNSAGNVVAIEQGSFGTQPTTAPTFPAPITGGRFASATGATAATAPVKLISASESKFLQAEAVARGWATGDASALFLAGIKASFDAYSVSGYDAYVAAAPAAQFPADQAGRIKAIITQKYFAMNGVQGFEAWTEQRRTGYPDFLVVSKATALGTTDFPARILYPSTEITRNGNFPGLKTITEKVWWDK